MRPVRDPVVKQAALRLLKRGALSFDEVVKHCGFSRHAVYSWCREADIDPRACRDGVATPTWDRELERVQGMARRRPSKAELRRIADRAEEEFHRLHDRVGDAGDGIPEQL